MTFDPNNPPKPLTIDSSGRLVFASGFKVTYNNPFPTVNGSWGSGKMQGVVMHTMVGNLPGTVAVFNNPSYAASAHFGIAQDGSVWQFGPIGKGWIAWAQAQGNEAWYSIEHADNGNPDNPLTDEQLTSSALIVEFLSRFAGFPLKEANTVNETGYGVHFMGGAAWGGHSCPQDAQGHGPRAGQRAEILGRARIIRNGGPLAGTVQDVPGGVWTDLTGTDARVLLDAPAKIRVLAVKPGKADAKPDVAS